MRKAVVCGAGGFIGRHLVRRLEGEGYWVRGVDIKHYEFTVPPADGFLLGDLRGLRFVDEAEDGSELEIWGDGEQTRSFLCIDDCLDAVRLLMSSDFSGPVSIGSEELVSINGLAALVAGRTLRRRPIPGPLGVRGCRSDNTLIGEKLGWAPAFTLRAGIEKTDDWIREQVTRTARPRA